MQFRPLDWVKHLKRTLDAATNLRRLHLLHQLRHRVRGVAAAVGISVGYLLEPTQVPESHVKHSPSQTAEATPTHTPVAKKVDSANHEEARK